MKIRGAKVTMLDIKEWAGWLVMAIIGFGILMAAFEG